MTPLPLAKPFSLRSIWNINKKTEHLPVEEKNSYTYYSLACNKRVSDFQFEFCLQIQTRWQHNKLESTQLSYRSFKFLFHCAAGVSLYL